jgi:hypothetical protein
MKESRAGKPIVIGEFTVVPLEEMHTHHATGGRGLAVFVTRKPAGIVVISPVGSWALDMDGAHVPLETCTQEFEGLRELLEGTRG